MDEMIDAHYFMLPTQGNIYSLAILKLISGVNKLIVASLKKNVFSFEYQENFDRILKPTVREIPCTYIPSGAEIVSIDAFNKSNSYDDFQIGIAIAKQSADGNHETYLNIYSEKDLDSSYVLNLESIAQNCLMLELNFIPYYLTHVHVGDNSDTSTDKEIVWLLSGSDAKIHLFRSDPTNHGYSKADTSELFPELATPPDIVLWLDVSYNHDFTRRMSAIGCECGTVQIFTVNVKTNSVISSHTDDLNGPISQVTFFSLFPEEIDRPDCIQEDKIHSETSSKKGLNLVVCSTIETSVVYMNVDEEGFGDKHRLEGSDLHDACLCACAADISMTGRKQLLIGTYGLMILIYNWADNCWKLSWKHSTSTPVHTLRYVDLIGDGTCQLVVHTLSGVDILQHDPDKVKRTFLTRLEKLTKGARRVNEKDEPLTSTENLS